MLVASLETNMKIEPNDIITYWILLSTIWQNIKLRLQYWKLQTGSVQYAPVLHRKMSGWHVTLLSTSHWTVARECIIIRIVSLLFELELRVCDQMINLTSFICMGINVGNTPNPYLL